MAADKDGPIKIRDIPPEELAEVHEHVEGPKVISKLFGEAGYFMPDAYNEYCYKIYNMEIRPDDIFVVTFPKSGTTWTQELVWLLVNNHDYETAAKEPLTARFPFLEFSVLFRSKSVIEWMKKLAEDNPLTKEFYETFSKDLSHVEGVMNLPSPRLIKTHMAMSLLPPSLLDTAKVIYVARDPRDVAVSYYHHQQFMKFNGFKSEFKDFWNLFLKNKVDWAPMAPHIKEAWEKKHHPNMLFLFYEDLCKDLPAAVRQVAQFLNKPVTEEQMLRLCDHLNIDNFRHNKSVNFDLLKQMDIGKKDGQFIRKGKAGGWHEYFDEDMTKQAEQYIRENFEGTGIEFNNNKRK